MFCIPYSNRDVPLQQCYSCWAPNFLSGVHSQQKLQWPIRNQLISPLVWQYVHSNIVLDVYYICHSHFETQTHSFDADCWLLPLSSSSVQWGNYHCCSIKGVADRMWIQTFFRCVSSVCFLFWFFNCINFNTESFIG